MKKIVLIFISLFLTGCLGETGKGYITKNCTKNENINGESVNTNIEIKSKEGNLVSVVIKETYNTDDITNIINSKKSEQNVYSRLNGITLDIDNNTFTYTIDVENVDNLIIEKFNIKSEQHKQIKYYEEIGYTCK